MNYVSELMDLIEGDVDNSPETLNKYSRDWSIFDVRPEVVVFPKHVEDIKALVRYVSLKKNENPFISLTVRAAGTDMTGGPLNDSIIMDVSRYIHGVISINTGSFGTQAPLGHSYEITGIARVLPGTYYRDFEKEVTKKGLIMPCFPASKDLCAVGGMVANNGAGEKSLKYGQNKDFVKALKVVLYDGEEYEIKPVTKNELEAIMLEQNARGTLYRSVWNIIRRNEKELREAKPKTPKNASGYLLWDVWNEETGIFDPTKLFVGAQGTTGIITEIAYGLVPLEEHSKLLVIFLKDLKVIPPLLNQLLKLDVETLEMYDDNTLKFSMRFFKDFVKTKGLWGTIVFGLRFIPEMFLIIRRGMPKIIMLVEFVSNNEEQITKELSQAVHIAKHFKLTYRTPTSLQDNEKYWMMRRDSFKMLTEHTKETQNKRGGKYQFRTAPFIDDVVVSPEVFPKFFPRLTEVLANYDLTFTIVGHIGSGNLHIIPFMDFNNPNTKDIILELSDIVYPLVREFGGSITAEHNDGLIRTPYLNLQFSESILSVFKEFKQAADPEGVFNPKKKVGATKADIAKYIISPSL